MADVSSHRMAWLPRGEIGSAGIPSSLNVRMKRESLVDQLLSISAPSSKSCVSHKSRTRLVKEVVLRFQLGSGDPVYAGLGHNFNVQRRAACLGLISTGSRQ